LSDFLLNRIVFYQLDCVRSNKSILCVKELFQTTLTILEERDWSIFRRGTWAINFRDWSDVGNFQESGNLPIVMHLLEKLYNNSDIMELAVQQFRADLVLE